MDSMHEAYKSLENFWKVRARNDGTMLITFITYFESKEVLFKAFDELSFAGVDQERIKLSDSDRMVITARVFTDMDRIALVFFNGLFNKQEAKEVILIFSKYADREANEKDLGRVSASYALEAQEKGKGGLVWIDWPDV